jgi:hypothetical protein
VFSLCFQSTYADLQQPFYCPQCRTTFGHSLGCSHFGRTFAGLLQIANSPQQPKISYEVSVSPEENPSAWKVLLGNSLDFYFASTDDKFLVQKKKKRNLKKPQEQEKPLKDQGNFFAGELRNSTNLILFRVEKAASLRSLEEQLSYERYLENSSQEMEKFNWNFFVSTAVSFAKRGEMEISQRVLTSILDIFLMDSKSLR